MKSDSASSSIGHQPGAFFKALAWAVSALFWLGSAGNSQVLEKPGSARDQGPEAHISPEALERLRAEALIQAASRGDRDRIRELLDEGTPVDHRFRGMDSALQAAILGGHPETATLLLESGADPNWIGNRSLPPLESAWQVDSPTIARGLLTAGARIPSTSSPSSSLLVRAIDRWKPDWIELLREFGAALETFTANRLLAKAVVGASSHAADQMRLLLELGAKTSFLERGRPLLHLAIINDSLAAVNILLEHGAPLELRDRRLEESALYLAVKMSRISILHRLIEAGADLEARALDGTSAIYLPLSQRNEKLLQLLIDSGALVNVSAKDGQTPLMVIADWRRPAPSLKAEEDSQIAMIETLLDQGAQIDAENRRGETAFFLAGTACNYPAMKVLAQRGAVIEEEAWIEILQAACEPRWASVLDELRLELELPLPSLEALVKGPLRPADAVDLAAQRQTLQEIRETGTAWLSWLTDQIAWTGPEATTQWASYSPQSSPSDISGIPRISASQLRELLIPFYARTVPEKDGWGYPYEYRMADSLLVSGPILVIRSTGSDGHFNAKDYPEPRLQKGLFPSHQTHRDIVWVDGFFVQAPRILRGREEISGHRQPWIAIVDGRSDGFGIRVQPNSKPTDLHSRIHP